VGECEGNSHVEDLDLERIIILKWVFTSYDGTALIGVIWLFIETNAWNFLNNRGNVSFSRITQLHRVS